MSSGRAVPVLAGCALAVACRFDPPGDDGTMYSCAEQPVCPSGFECVAGSCVSERNAGVDPAPAAAFTPSNGVDLAWVDGVELTLQVPNGDTWIIDTGSGDIVDCATMAGLPGLAAVEFRVEVGDQVNLGVFPVASVDVEPNGILRAIGDNALVILSAGDVTVAGQIRAGGGAAAWASPAASACFEVAELESRKCS